jgi:hypothetical protein
MFGLWFSAPAGRSALSWLVDRSSGREVQRGGCAPSQLPWAERFEACDRHALVPGADGAGSSLPLSLAPRHKRASPPGLRTHLGQHGLIARRRPAHLLRQPARRAHHLLGLIFDNLSAHAPMACWIGSRTLLAGRRTSRPSTHRQHSRGPAFPLVIPAEVVADRHAKLNGRVLHWFPSPRVARRGHKPIRADRARCARRPGGDACLGRGARSSDRDELAPSAPGTNPCRSRASKRSAQRSR